MNIRGIKQKVSTLKEIIADERPQIVAIVETLLQEKEKVKIEGYKTITMKRKKGGGGGICGMVQEELWNIITVVKEEEERGEALWLRMDNKKIKTRIGIIYTPQESRKKVAEMKEVYQSMKEEIEKTERNEEHLIMVGDYNCHVGKIIKENKEKETTAGKMFKGMVKDHKLKILNTSEKCKGVWTRQQGTSRSVIDYVIRKKEDEQLIEEMTIDEDKEIAPYKITKENGKLKMVYSDHNVIKIQINLVGNQVGRRQTKPVMKYNETNLRKFKERTSQVRLQDIWDKTDKTTQEKYKEWNENIMKIAKESFQEQQQKKKEISWKKIKILMKAKRERQKALKKETNKQKKQMIKEQITYLIEYIQKTTKEEEGNKVRKIVDQLNREGLQSRTFWKFREKMRRKDEEKRTAMKDENGRIQEEEEKIKEIYRNHYKNLLQGKQANGIEEKKAEEISKIRTRSRNQLAKDNEIKEITNEEVDKAIKELNNKKVADKHGWKNEMLKNCGDNMKESVKKALNEIGKGKIVEEWKEVQIKSIYKNKGKKDEMKNQRGIFITSNMSKLFEKVIKERNREKLEKKITRFQNVAMKGRGARDNLMILQAIMDYNRQIGNNVYILITDAVKCFDKLWLEDCCNSLYEIGMEVNEIQVIEELNTNIKAKIDTPYGMTEEIKIREAVKQGSVTGPILCIAETDQVNRINE